MLKKVLGFAGGALLVSVLALWMLFIRAPSAEAQCGHVLSLLPSEIAEQGGEQLRTDCLKSAEKGENEGLVPYAKRSKCLMAAQSYDDVEQCR